MRRTRFAPAPTGFLHLGHVASALYVWGLARRHGAAVLLRVEDHDRQRSQPPFERALLDDLDWLGFVPALYPTAAFRHGACESRQSDRGQHYARAAERLDRAGLVYGCRCSRQDLALHGRTADGELRYPGTCRDRGYGLTDGVTWRVRIDDAEETFDDLLLGRTIQNAAAAGDVVIRDVRGNWTYQFAVSVDDLVQEIDLVVRGRDLLASTARQIFIARLLGRSAPPTFAHHPVLMKSATQKLSKSDGDTGVHEMRAAGRTPAEVIGEAAYRAGLTPTPGSLALDDALGLQNLSESDRRGRLGAVASAGQSPS